MKNNTHYFLLFAFCMSFQFVYAQKEGNIWHFGEGAALDFNSGNATVTSPSSIITFEGSASIADADGNLLFYTNGGGRNPILAGETSGKIWNRNHEVMYDMGFTEGGGFSATQSSVIIPKPGDPQNYYLFTMEEGEFDVGGAVPGQPLGRGLSYFDVDMSLNGGLGGVAAYEGSIFVPSYEGLCAIRHTNGSDYWIIVHNDTFGLAVFPVNPNGVGIPVFYNTTGVAGGGIKGSPDGKWVSVANYLLSFNATTGVLGNPLELDVFPYFSEFSPNSKRLFFNTLNTDIGYLDLTSPNINSSTVILGQVQQGTDFLLGPMQVAPDGKIYFVQLSFTGDTVYLSDIACPNTTPLLELETFGFSRLNYGTFYSLPNFDNAIFLNDTEPPVVSNLGNDQTLCGDQTIVLSTGVNNATYTWSNGAQTPTLSVSTPGTYTVTVSPGCGAAVVDSVAINQVFINLNAGSDSSICIGDTLQLAAESNGQVSWTPANLVTAPSTLNPFFTGNSTSTLFITSQLEGCTLIDSITITVIDRPTVGIMALDTTTIEAGESVQLSGMGTGTILWSPATGLSCTTCTNPIATPTETTTYTLEVTNAAGCSNSEKITITVTPPDCTPKIPNAFTPNSDSTNDSFFPIGNTIDAYNLTIYNRWGQEIFSDTKPWDGQLGGKDAPCDVYIYKLNMQICGNNQTFLGDVTLIR
jgi:gliding motility-associated-like protein